MTRLLEPFLRDSSGSVAIEYVVIASAIGLALIPILPTLRDLVSALYSGVAAGF
jgi:Flp pilus assembly pilin Flp